MQRLLPEFPKQIFPAFYAKFLARISDNMRAVFTSIFLPGISQEIPSGIFY